MQIQDRSVSESISAIVGGKHKLIVGPGSRIQLFDVLADPDEQKDLADEQPDLVEALRERMDARRAIDATPAF